MTYLTSLFQTIKSNSFLNGIRNQFNIRPTYARMANTEQFNFYSDLFPWRQDKNLSTTFRLSNPFAIYEKNERVEINLNIFDRNGNTVGKHNFETTEKNIFLNLQDFLSNKDGDFGTFEVFLQPMSRLELTGTNFVNRCYVGFKNPYTKVESFCHGNFISRRLNQNSAGKWGIHGDILTKTLCMNSYWIQKQFDMTINNELFFSNGSNRTSWISLNSGKKHYLHPNASLLLEVNRKVVVVKSDLALPRPIIFSYTDGWLDCHHA